MVFGPGLRKYKEFFLFSNVLGKPRRPLGGYFGTSPPAVDNRRGGPYCIKNLRKTKITVKPLRAFMHSSSLVVHPTWITSRDSMCLSSGKGVALTPLDRSANGLSNQDIGFTHSDRPSYRAYLSRHTIQSTALPAPVRGPGADRPAGSGSGPLAEYRDLQVISRLL